MSEPLILVDVLNLSWRSHYAFRNLSVNNEPTGILYGFLKAVLALKKISPHILFCWDGNYAVVPAELNFPKPIQLGKQRPVEKITNWRQSIWKGYKSNRDQKDPKELAAVRSQLDKIVSMLCWMNYVNVSLPGCEADDIIGIVCGYPRDFPILIYSNDRDFYQLIDNRTTVIVPKKENGEHRYIDATAVQREFSLLPFQWATYLALGGDASDSIKPVKGLGPVTATTLTLLGADLNLPFHRQPNALQSKYREKLESVWLDVQRCYECARIPLHSQDPRLHLPQEADSYLGISMALALKNRGKTRCCDQNERNMMGFFAEHEFRDFIQHSEEFMWH